MPAAWAYEWEGIWSPNEKGCKEEFTIGLDKSELDFGIFEEGCEVKKITAVGPETLITASCSGEGHSLTRKIIIRMNSGRLTIKGISGNLPDTLIRCPNQGQKPN